ncbi:MAG: sugar ABC transporter substrate-binding protein [Rhodobacteraceae bacterium]|nr:sugar ABC transporter substrate-binding protein [Paracoccaceae bacterium]
MKTVLKGIVVAASLAMTGTVALADGKFAVSLGWQENESGQRQTVGFEEAFLDKGVDAGDVLYSNANYDPKLQSEQIDAFIKTNPKALFVTPSDPAGITQAVQRAIDAGIPVFVADAIIAGVPAVTSITSNDFGMGVYSMRWLIDKIGGKGKIAMVDLPNNEAWDLRGQGARYELSQHPEVELVAKWSYDTTGAVSPRQAIENMLTANPAGNLDGIWNAWDGAAMEGALAIKAAGRAGEITTTGIDGGEYSFSIMSSGDVFGLTMAQSIYYMSYNSVHYAMEYLDGNTVPRFIIAPVYAVTPEVLGESPADAFNYDIPGVAKSYGWKPVL